MKNANREKHVLENIRDTAFCMLKDTAGVFRFPFVVPGAGYEQDLWDWDSYWSGYALSDIVEYFRDDPVFDYAGRREKLLAHLEGNVLNFLDNAEPDGFIPGTITVGGLFSTLLRDTHRNGEPVNQAKPFLCAQALRIARRYGETEWVREGLPKLAAYLDYYRAHQYHEPTGLYVWATDIMIGMDNNPTVFGRPYGSTADIYLNSFLYNELNSAAELFRMAGRPDANKYAVWATELKDSINRYLWDERDGFYYSADLLVRDPSTTYFHHGMKPFWNVLPMKIRMWPGFLPMMYGISDERQNERLIAHACDPAFACDFGIRTLAKDERMYTIVKTSNPSNWLGPVWLVANYCLFEGFLRAGRRDLAEDMKDKTVRLLGMDIEKTGHMSESYIPETGEPMMYSGFLNWDCLAVSMIRELEEKG